MQSAGRQTVHPLVLLAACAVGLGVVWFVLPNRIVADQIHLRLNDPPVALTPANPDLTVQLLSLTIPPRTANAGQLNLQDGAAVSTLPVAVGKTVELNGATYDVAAIRPWAGLVHRPPGTPMLNLAVKPPDSDWIENVFVQRGGARIVTPEIAVLVAGDEGEASPSPARWGIVEGDRTHWISSFVPGTGLELADGSIVTLLLHRPSARILVEIEKDGTASQTWVDANRQPPDSLIKYEDASAVAYHLEIDFDASDSAIVSLIEGDLEHWTRPADIGTIVSDDAFGLSMRVDQIEQDALALLPGESPWLEVVLSNSDHVLRVREDESIRVGETSMTFEAIANPQPATAQIAFGDDERNLTSETSFELGEWRFDGLHVVNPAEVALSARRFDSRLYPRIGLTAFLLILAVPAAMALRPRA